MRVLNLGGARDAGAGCALVDFAGVRVLLDCGCSVCADDRAVGLERRAPQLRPPDLCSFAMESLDAVLITSTAGFLGLPILTERLGYHGRVLAPEPVLFIARRLLTEIATLVRFSGLPDPAEDTAPTESEVQACVARVTPVHYGESIALMGSALIAIAHSSGSELGGAYWVLVTASERVALVGDISCCAPPRYPLPFDPEPLIDVDAVVVTSTTASTATALTFDQALHELVSAITATVNGGGSVLVPCTVGNTIFDVLELLAASAIRVPMFVVAPAAHDVFRYTAVCAEWLLPSRAERIFVPSDTFAHTQLVASGALRLFAEAGGNLSKPNTLGAFFHEPCIVFASHPSCRLGDVSHFVELFGSNPKSLIALVGVQQNKKPSKKSTLPSHIPYCSSVQSRRTSLWKVY